MKARMPKMPGGLGNLQQLAEQAKQMQTQIDEATKQLETQEYSKTVGGGAVSVTVSGKMEIQKLEIKPEVVDPEDVEMLSDLIIAATNEAIREVIKDKEETLGKISGSMNIPGIG